MRNLLSYKLFERKDIEKMQYASDLAQQLIKIPVNLIIDIYEQIKAGETFGVTFDKGYTNRGGWLSTYFPLGYFVHDISKTINYPKAEFKIADAYWDSTMSAKAAFSLNKKTKDVSIELYSKDYADLIQHIFEDLDRLITLKYNADNKIQQPPYSPVTTASLYERSIKYIETNLEKLNNYNTSEFMESLVHELIHYKDFIEYEQAFYSSSESLSSKIKRIISKEEARLTKEGDKDPKWNAMITSRAKQTELYYSSNHEYNAHYMHSLYSVLNKVAANPDMNLKSAIDIFKYHVGMKNFPQPQKERMLKRFTNVWNQEIQPLINGVNPLAEK